MKYRKKPVVIEAVQFNGYNYTEIQEFVGQDFDWTDGKCEIKTLEGKMHVSKLDFVIKGVSGECYPCKPDIFELTYEPAE